MPASPRCGMGPAELIGQYKKRVGSCRSAHGIRINNINAGVTDTPMQRAHGAEIIPPLAARAAHGRIGTPDEIADVAVWLTNEACFITGQSILVDGGFTIPGPR